jgi:hypothetical protein
VYGFEHDLGGFQPSWRRAGVIWIQAREQVERGQSRPVNFLEIAAARVGGGSFSEQDLGEAADNRQLILEIVAALVVVRHCQVSAFLRPKSSSATASRSPSLVNGLSR